MNVLICWFMGHKGIGTRPLFFSGILGMQVSAQLMYLSLITKQVLQNKTVDRDWSGQVRAICLLKDGNRW